MCYLFTGCFKGLNTYSVCRMIIKERSPEIVSRLRTGVSEHVFTVGHYHIVFRSGNSFRKLSVVRICVLIGKWAFVVCIIRKTLYWCRRNSRKRYCVLVLICDKASMRLRVSRLIRTTCYGARRFGASVMMGNTNVFWRVTSCSLVKAYRCLERYWLLPLAG